MRLTIFSVAYNVERILYPWRASIESALHFADEVLIVECGSNDGTKEALTTWAITEPKLRIIYQDWFDNPTVLKLCADIASHEARSDFNFYLNLDEVLHESSDFVLSELTEVQIKYGGAHYNHFLGDFETLFPFVYERVPRLMRGHSATWSNDACALSVPATERVMTLPVEVYHYGKVDIGRAKEAADKELWFTGMYRHIAPFPDPTTLEVIERRGVMRFSEQVKLAWERAGKPDVSWHFTGTHPRFVQGWISEMIERERLC